MLATLYSFDEVFSLFLRAVLCTGQMMNFFINLMRAGFESSVGKEGSLYERWIKKY